MGFASKYLSTHLFGGELLIPREPAIDLKMIVVIPAYTEPRVSDVLNSLSHCIQPNCSVEVVVVVNSPEETSSDVRAINQSSLKIIQQYAEQIHCNDRYSWLQIYAIEAAELPRKWAGVGLARKIGMDEAVRRFDQLDRPEGVIISLDADCRVDQNYFQELESLFIKNHKVNGCTIYFEHPVSGQEFSAEVYLGIVFYELYMRYYRNALEWSGFPHSFYTVGSAFAVRAAAYTAQGGMNKRQAGEDFYFIQKLIPGGGLVSLNTTRVMPSCRLSDRVPFGTGPALQKWTEGDRDLSKTYSFRAFKDLKEFFVLVPELYRIGRPEYDVLIRHLSDPMLRFLQEDSFYESVNELSGNCSTCTVFVRRFWHYFNAFKVLKFLNLARDEYYETQSLIDACQMLKKALNAESAVIEGMTTDMERVARELLTYFRKKDRKE